MIFLYNLLQIALAALLWPVLVPVVLLRSRYRGRVWRRLSGSGLSGLAGLGPGPRIWVHALSVGEVRSAAGLIAALRRRFPGHRLVLSLATASGEALARRELAGVADAVIPFPLDFFIPVRLWFSRVDPEIFVQVETDFWPNFLHALSRRRTRAVLVNGRISARSGRGYGLLRPLFVRLFSAWDAVCVATREDGRAFLALGVPGERLHVTGNLKFDTAAARTAGGEPPRVPPGLDQARAGRPMLVAASTHAGEEELLIGVFSALREKDGRLFLLIAPRDPGRGGEVARLARAAGWRVAQRSQGDDAAGADVFVLDSIGELAAVFPGAWAAFIGGSLVPRRGHNPLEAAACGVPVVFGPSMEDFSGVAAGLRACGGGVEADGGAALRAVFSGWLDDPRSRDRAGAAARDFVRRHEGVADRVAGIIATLPRRTGRPDPLPRGGGA